MLASISEFGPQTEAQDVVSAFANSVHGKTSKTKQPLLSSFIIIIWCVPYISKF
jgi:hypothetical protein